MLTTQGSPPERTIHQTTSSSLPFTSWCSAYALCGRQRMDDCSSYDPQDVRYESKVAWTQILPLVSAFTDDSPMSREREDDGVLRTMMVHSRGRMWFGNHSGCADIWSQADQCIRSLHTLCLSTRHLKRRALPDNDWLLLWHVPCISLDLAQVDSPKISDSSRNEYFAVVVSDTPHRSTTSLWRMENGNLRARVVRSILT